MTELAAVPSGARSQPISQPLADVLLAAFVGIAAFLAVAGPQILDTGNILWLAGSNDSLTHHLGWEFFRRSGWTWPLGLSPSYGLQFGSSIVFSDSIPLLAIPLKLLSPVLPVVFQYTGWWVLVCFLLQAYFSVRIVGLFSRDAVVKLAVAILLSFAPPMLWRLTLHYSLIAHWIILAAIYLYWCTPSRLRGLQWIVLMGIAMLVHTYLFGMCAPIWLASIARRRIIGGPTSPHWFFEIAIVLALGCGLLWVAGFFPLRYSMIGWGYGYFRTNLLSLVNPDGGMEFQHWSWSSIIPNLPHALGDYEGFAYAGLGGLAAMVLALPLVWTERHAYRGSVIWPLVVAAVLLFAFAVSPVVTVGNRQLVINVPVYIYNLAGIMRSSGRFVWPVYYLLALAAVWLVNRSMGDRVAGPLLLMLAALQIYDTYPGWSSVRAKLEIDGHALSTSIDDAALAPIVSHYSNVRMLPALNMAQGWDQVADFALRHDLPTDATYLARPDTDGYAAYMGTIDATIAAHGLARDSLYFLDHYYGWKVGSHLAPGDALFKVGDFYVYAPGWQRFGVATTLPAARLWGPM